MWVLTGDKQETAIEIAKSCQLIDAQMQLIKVNSALATAHFSKPKTKNYHAAHEAAQKEVCQCDAPPSSRPLSASLPLLFCSFLPNLTLKLHRLPCRLTRLFLSG